MRNLFSVIVLILLTVPALISCAGSGQSGEREYVFRSNIGNATEIDMQRLIPRYISRINFVLYRDNVTLEGTYFETEWRERALFDDEIELGATQARNMIIISSRSPTGQVSLAHRAQIEIYNQVYIPDEGGWVRYVSTPQAEEYFRDISRRLAQELESGVRNF
ncbi:hypothetical protein CYPRO_0958 [Cyclonatronum proteinivorum]|uniref:Uncharacterized protein n=1 Tax=Cyclonatronum proteinivorum TaxID=1457365 RepID=A0A345UID3_9BACT|nr:hypothetical protein [Cyclonatronum proteinivorum]AXJ00235.1 hypothetical protein CYPRO_0958 [Cyclonatronum proteinivorum]